MRVIGVLSSGASMLPPWVSKESCDSQEPTDVARPAVLSGGMVLLSGLEPPTY